MAIIYNWTLKEVGLYKKNNCQVVVQLLGNFFVGVPGLNIW